MDSIRSLLPILTVFCDINTNSRCDGRLDVEGSSRLFGDTIWHEMIQDTGWLDIFLSRSHALVEAGCVFALKKVAEGASPATKERIALCFRRLATEPLNRGLIVQQGGLVRGPDFCVTGRNNNRSPYFIH